jgi:hypothetical protein
MKEQVMKGYFSVPVAAILGFTTGSPALYPGDCVQTPGGPAPTVRVVQQTGYDPPQFDVEFQACKPTARIATEGDEGASRLGSTAAAPRQ